MSEPEYVVCLECESPVYVFEWRNGRLTEALCGACGNDDPALFVTEEQLEELSGTPVEE